MDIKLKSIQAFLQENPRNVIYVTNLNTGDTIKSRVTFNEILQKHGSIEKFFYSITILEKETMVGVQLKKPNGSSFKNYKNPILLELTTDHPLEEDNAGKVATTHVATSLPATQQQLPTKQIYTPEVVHQQNYAQGLSAVQIAEGMIAKKEITFLEKDIRKLEKEIDKKESIIRANDTEINRLNKLLIDANSNLAVAEQKKEMAVALEAMKKEPSVSPETIELLTAALPQVATIFSKSTAPQATVESPSGLGATLNNLSQKKQDIVKLISKPEINENMAAFLEKVFFACATMPAFTAKVEQLIKEYNI